MRQINLKEYVPSGPHTLTSDQRDALRRIQSLTVTRADTEGTEAAYHLTPGSTVGAVEIGDLSVLIRPKIGIPQLLSMACFAMGAYKSQEQRLFDFKEDETLPDTLALALVAAAQRAFSRGLLHDYLTREEPLYTVRGRIRFDEQIRRRFGIPMPVEVRYEEFTDDILANRLVKAAAARLGKMRLRSEQARQRLGRVASMLDNISLVEFPRRNVPEVRFSRLNEHYRDVVELSRLILRHSSFEASRGRVRATGFLMDMNDVFQDFVTTALREALGVSDRTLRAEQVVYLDQARKVQLKPDLSWWDGDVCTFVGDAKYKRMRDQRVPNADLYQILAYATALNLPGGMLLYAKGEADPVIHEIRHSGKKLQVAALDLSGSLEDILERVEQMADSIRKLRENARRLSHAA